MGLANGDLCYKVWKAQATSPVTLVEEWLSPRRRIQRGGE